MPAPLLIMHLFNDSSWAKAYPCAAFNAALLRIKKAKWDKLRKLSVV